ncbi:MAG: CsbD family protein [Saprospiraceae bacterium]
MSAFSDQVKGKWKQIQGKLKEQYGQLTDDDLTYQEGQEEQLLGILQEKLGKTKSEVKDLIDSF